MNPAFLFGFFLLLHVAYHRFPRLVGHLFILTSPSPTPTTPTASTHQLIGEDEVTPGTASPQSLASFVDLSSELYLTVVMRLNAVASLPVVENLLSCSDIVGEILDSNIVKATGKSNPPFID